MYISPPRKNEHGRLVVPGTGLSHALALIVPVPDPVHPINGTLVPVQYVFGLMLDGTSLDTKRMPEFVGVSVPC